MPADAIIFAYAAAVVWVAWFLFRVVPFTRPTLGVVNPRDVLLLFAVVVAAPYFYLVLPTWITAIVLSASVVWIIHLTFRPARPRWVFTAATVLVVVLGIGAAVVPAERSNVLLASNAAAWVVPLAGAACLLVWCGMQTRDVAALAVVLAAYELLLGRELTLLVELMDDASGLPFAPVFGWSHEGEEVAIGLGAVLLAALFPIAARKAFGRAAGLVALVTSLGAIALFYGFVDSTMVGPDRSATLVLAPLFGLEYCLWARKRGRERPMWEYLRDEPHRSDAGTSIPAPAEPDVSQPVAL